MKSSTDGTTTPDNGSIQFTYNENVQGTSAIGALKKIRPEGGEPVVVRDDKGNRAALSPDGSTLYFVIERPAVNQLHRVTEPSG